MKATFAGGCFWCMEPVFAAQKGVLNVEVGYTGGSTKNPTYEEVCSGTTGHFEAIQILFDPEKIAYERLLRIFFLNIDPTDPSGQFVDVGTQYQTAVFYHSEGQKDEALRIMDDLKRSRGFSTIATKVLPATPFYPAEEWHQRYYEKEPLRYKSYKKGSGRERRLEQLWGPTENCGPCNS